MNKLMKLSEWERGIRLESRYDQNLFAFLWFYEWHLFDAVQKGEHTSGSHNWEWNIDKNATSAYMNAGWLKLQINATENGADVSLVITNLTNHDWPAIAAIIPCLNPGNPLKPSNRNDIFLDEEHLNTYFLSKNGLELIKGEFPREIHFNQDCHSTVMAWDKERDDDLFVFDEKWPTSKRDAYAGIMIRESDYRRYVMGIAWESFLSVQGHNPWNCLHLSVKIGPLKKGETKTVKGRMYLFEGSKKDCLQAFKKDFA
jgi:hypothetical protein